MSDKIKFGLRKLLCFALSIILAFSMVAITLGAFSIGLLQSQDYIEKHMAKYSTEIINQINEDFCNLEGKTSFPVEAFTTALDDEDISQIISTVVNNFVYNYQTDFSSDDELYNDIKSSISSYCKENSIATTDKELSKAASLAIYEINETIGGSSSLNVYVFRFVQSKKMMYLICVSVLLIIVSVVVLDLINFGRHRKYNYIGMGLTTAGCVMTIGILFVKYKGYLNNCLYSTVSSFNLGIASCVNNTLNYDAIVGVIFFVAGIIMLILNYNYFRKKGIRVKENRQRNSQLRKEYMDQYNAKKYETSQLTAE